MRISHTSKNSKALNIDWGIWTNVRVELGVYSGDVVKNSFLKRRPGFHVCTR